MYNDNSIAKTAAAELEFRDRSASFYSLTAKSAALKKRLNNLEAKTSKKQTRPKTQLNQSIAIGRRKEESLEPALSLRSCHCGVVIAELSLQDVFSDSANAFGS